MFGKLSAAKFITTCCVGLILLSLYSTRQSSHLSKLPSLGQTDECRKLIRPDFQIFSEPNYNNIELEKPIYQDTRSPVADLSKLDIVYTYVNGSFEEHQQLKEYWFKQEQALRKEQIKPNDSVSPSLSKDNNELCFSLRSIEKFMPWFEGNIYIVADQVPFWLNVSHPQIHLVTTDQIMARENLPTFNSHSIEANLHKIPDLKEHYLYFNDDYMLGQPVTLNDFFSNDGCPIVYTDDRSTTDFNISYVNVHRKAMWNANAYLALYGLNNSQRYFLPHAPHLLVKSVVERVWSDFPDLHSELSSHRFRSMEDVHPAYFYSMYMLEQPERYCAENRRMKNRCLPGEDFCIKLLYNNLNDVKIFFKEIKSRTKFPKFFSINDHTDPTKHGQSQILIEYSRFLRELFPQPSRFERQDCSLSN